MYKANDSVWESGEGSTHKVVKEELKVENDDILDEIPLTQIGHGLTVSVFRPP